LRSRIGRLELVSSFADVEVCRSELELV